MKFETGKRYRHSNFHCTWDILVHKIVDQNKCGTLMEIIYIDKLNNTLRWLPRIRTDLIMIKTEDYGDWMLITEEIEGNNSGISDNM